MPKKLIKTQKPIHKKLLIKHALNFLFQLYCKKTLRFTLLNLTKKIVKIYSKSILLHANVESLGITISHRKLCVYNLVVNMLSQYSHLMRLNNLATAIPYNVMKIKSIYIL